MGPISTLKHCPPHTYPHHSSIILSLPPFFLSFFLQKILIKLQNSGFYLWKFILEDTVWHYGHKDLSKYIANLP